MPPWSRVSRRFPWNTLQETDGQEVVKKGLWTAHGKSNLRQQLCSRALLCAVPPSPPSHPDPCTFLGHWHNRQCKPQPAVRRLAARRRTCPGHRRVAAYAHWYSERAWAELFKLRLSCPVQGRRLAPVQAGRPQRSRWPALCVRGGICRDGACSRSLWRSQIRTPASC